MFPFRSQPGNTTHARAIGPPPRLHPLRPPARHRFRLDPGPPALLHRRARAHRGGQCGGAVGGDDAALGLSASPARPASLRQLGRHADDARGRRRAWPRLYLQFCRRVGHGARRGAGAADRGRHAHRDGGRGGAGDPPRPHHRLAAQVQHAPRHRRARRVPAQLRGELVRSRSARDAPHRAFRRKARGFDAAGPDRLARSRARRDPRGAAGPASQAAAGGAHLWQAHLGDARSLWPRRPPAAHARGAWPARCGGEAARGAHLRQARRERHARSLWPRRSPAAHPRAARGGGSAGPPRRAGGRHEITRRRNFRSGIA